jgi:hypothetical protein
MRTEMWRVVDGHGGVREVPVRVEGERMFVGAGPGPRVWPVSTLPRFAVTSLAVSMGWPVREILAPEESQRATLLGGLLAVIHRDGGHYAAQHGVERATGEAVRRVLADREELALAEREVLAERARCAAVCREVAAQRWAVGLAEAAATECAEAIERGAVER